ncbi:hypothetical protein [Spirosoma rhododendri]|uniref:HEPN domain-containing protein n=1 Tax=Spirosoma rhododendri TaxID=2728024 RepID=A0A7L5DIP6_9BACT|nr:hypothetical protein [Spirosoma rhododendri]QJD77935.1 hypothetical protein HH216_05470 [Spirosoma rhododendri]
MQKLAQQRLADAAVLLAADQPDTAFYLAGYAIECALKAAVCRTLDQNDFYQPDRTNKGSRYVQDRVFREFKTHNYSDLLVLSGLSAKFEKARTEDGQLETAWTRVRSMNWSEQVRYNLNSFSVLPVSEFVESVNTIVVWISKYW